MLAHSPIILHYSRSIPTTTGGKKPVNTIPLVTFLASCLLIYRSSPSAGPSSPRLLAGWQLIPGPSPPPPTPRVSFSLLPISNFQRNLCRPCLQLPFYVADEVKEDVNTPYCFNLAGQLLLNNLQLPNSLSGVNRHHCLLPNQMMGDGYFGVTGAAGIVFTAGNSTSVINNPGLPQTGSSSGSLPDSETGLKHDTGLAVEWSVNEQCKLEEGLVKYVDEPSIMKYIKIAATLPDKTVRDVALRCRWMTGKRPGKKVNIRKLAESSSKATPVLPISMATYSPIIHHVDRNDMLCFEGSGTSGSANPRNLLEQNNEVFSRIRANLHLLELQENIDLFCHTRNNITAILNYMRDMPGIMSQMPPLPVSIDENLANTILPYAAQPMLFGSDGGIPLKQDPRF